MTFSEPGWLLALALVPLFWLIQARGIAAVSRRQRTAATNSRWYSAGISRTEFARSRWDEGYQARLQYLDWPVHAALRRPELRLRVIAGTEARMIDAVVHDHDATGIDPEEATRRGQTPDAFAEQEAARSRPEARCSPRVAPHGRVPPRVPLPRRRIPPSPRTPSVTRIPRTLGGQTMPVGWNWTNSMSWSAAPAR